MIATRRRTLRTPRMLGQGDAQMFASGRGPCLVAFHGFGGTATDLRPVLDCAASQGFAVDGALMPGHGTRVEELQDVTFEHWLESGRKRARAAAEAHGAFVLVGFSLGSLVAMQLASERPEGLAGLVVLGNALTLAWYSSLPLAALSFLVGAGQMPDCYLVKPTPADLVDRTAMGRIVTYDRHPLRAALEVYKAGVRVRACVGAIGCPTLILHGRRDRVCPCDNAAWLARRLGASDVRVRIFERSAHVIGCDGECNEVAAEVASFVTRIGAALPASAPQAATAEPSRGAPAA